MAVSKTDEAETKNVAGATITEIPDPAAFIERNRAKIDAAPGASTLEIVETCFREHVHGTPLAHDTENVNRLQAFKADLIARLTK